MSSVQRRINYGPFVLTGGAGGGEDLTAPAYGSAEIGNVDTDTIVVTFTETVNSPGANYSAGVTIEADAVGQTISSSARQSDQRKVHYNLSAVLTLQQVVTWAYASASGDIEDQAVPPNALADVATKTVINNIGSHYRFNFPDNSGHLIHL
jgi:hypothetical protein